MKLMQIKHFLLALALVAVTPYASAAFQAGMTLEQVEAEARVQLASASLQQVAQNALAAKLDASLVTTALINVTSGRLDEVIAALLRAGAPLQAVVNAALLAGATRDEVTQGALAAGVTLPVVVAAIAAANAPGDRAAPAAGGSVSPS